jgi:hypothetical protein
MTLETDAREIRILRSFVGDVARACGLDDSATPADVLAAVSALYRETHREPGTFVIDTSKDWQQ